MANYYTDHPEIAFHLEHPLMKRIVELKERDYADKANYDDAPVNYDDAIENYKCILDITGDVAACGISGQIQHIAGMQDAGIIISINSDPEAPINKIADYIITGTVEEVVPKLIKYYKQNSK